MDAKEKHREYMRNYRREHRDEINANARLRYRRDPERYRNYWRKTYEQAKDTPEYKLKNRTYQKAWREKNREKYNTYQREYYRRKALKKGGTKCVSKKI